MAIQILSAQLANQIAAGEVVERPASVIKELVENSIDAGATRIDIDVEQGGSKAIRVRDNGKGIAQPELALALMRHATSKISCLDDLCAIISLGFRGEALASISSVSRLTLTSRPPEQKEAWQVYAEGRDMVPVINPASHPIGTSVEVLDLFYNTPARKRFLRADKTEFSHIDEIIRRIALAQPTVSFSLQHNGKLIRQYRAVQGDLERQKRVASICGNAFIQSAIKFDWQHDDLAIEGWISTQGSAELQYFYVNGRVVKDKLLNHAIKQAYHEQGFGPELSFSYVIYLTLAPQQVDVNVHPTKHEVRFHEARLVHDFVYQALSMALLKTSALAVDSESPALPVNRAAAGENIFTDSALKAEQEPLGKPPTPAAGQSPVAAGDTARHYVPPQRPSVNDGRALNRIYRQLIGHGVSAGNQDRADESPSLYQALFPAPQPTLPLPADALTQASELTLHSLEPTRSALLFECRFGRVLTLWLGQFALLEAQQDEQPCLQLLSLAHAQRALYSAHLLVKPTNHNNQEILLVPLALLLKLDEKQQLMKLQPILNQLGFDFAFDKRKIKINAVPLLLRKMNWQTVLPQFLQFLAESPLVEMSIERLAKWFAYHYWVVSHTASVEWSLAKVVQLLTELEQFDEHLVPFDDIVQPIELTAVVEYFNHDRY